MKNLYQKEISIVKVTLLSLFFITATGCGGGGGTSSGASNESVSAPASPVNTVTDDEPALNNQAPNNQAQDKEVKNTEIIVSLPEEKEVVTSELVAEESFLFDSTSQVSIHVDISHQSERAYLNICAKENGRIDLQNCYIKAPLTEGVYTSTVSIANNVTDLAAEIWFYSEDAEPLEYAWSRENGEYWYIQ